MQNRQAPAVRPLGRLTLVLAAALALAGCQSGFDAQARDIAPAERALPAEAGNVAPAIDMEACWAQAQLTGAEGQTEDHMVAVPCPSALDAAFWASLQRALSVRGLFDGPVNGIEDEATRAAIQRYQAPMGFDSPVLSLDAARQLGLLPWPRGTL